MVVHATVLALRKLRQEDPKFKATLSQVTAATKFGYALVGETKAMGSAPTETTN